MARFDAAKSLYGGATTVPGNEGLKLRVQEVLTCDFILEASEKAFGKPIGVDPCAPSNPDNWFAQFNHTLPEEAILLQEELQLLDKLKDPDSKKRKKQASTELKAYLTSGSLTSGWGDPSLDAYVNPQFDMLRLWMERCQREYFVRGRKVIALYPFRTRRIWWHPATYGAEIVSLGYSVVFKGHTNSFPADLCLVSFGCKLPPLGKMETDRRDRTGDAPPPEVFSKALEKQDLGSTDE